MPPSFCSAYFPHCMLRVPLRIILCQFSSIHIIFVRHLHYSNLLLIFSSVTHLTSDLHNHASLFFFTLLCRVLAKFQKMIISLVIMEHLASHWKTFVKFDISGFFFENLSRKFRCHNLTRTTTYCTERPVYIYSSISSNYSQNEKYFRKAVKKQKHILCITFFPPEIRAVYQIQ